MEGQANLYFQGLFAGIKSMKFGEKCFYFGGANKI